MILRRLVGPRESVPKSRLVGCAEENRMPPGPSKSAMSSTVVFLSLTDSLPWTEFLYFLNPQTLMTSWTFPSKTGALASKLLALRLQLRGPKCSVYSCSRAATIVSRETEELPGRSLVVFCESCIVTKSKLERPFSVAAVTPELLATSALFYTS